MTRFSRWLPIIGGAIAGAVIALIVATASSTNSTTLPFLSGIGVAIGEAGLGIRFDNASLTQALDQPQPVRPDDRRAAIRDGR